MKITEKNLGYFVESHGFKALLGGVKSNFVNLQTSFPELQFTRVKQTHGTVSVESLDTSKDLLLEADAHFSKTKNLALCISTADCIPVLIHDPISGYVASIHAGWRGVAGQIVPKTLQKLFLLGVQPGTLQVLIGPHIQMNSFEVSIEVCDEILSSIDASPKEKQSLYFRDLSPEKALVDLNQVMHQQLKMCGVIFDHITDFQIDTKTDPRFHSYRRDADKSGRQLSFIAKV